MKHLFILSASLILVFTFGCNTNTSNVSNSKQKNCSSTCSKTSAVETNASGYDKNMSKVCQQSCGVNDYSEGDVVGMVEAKTGDITTCPVSGAIYLVRKNSPELSHEGKTFHSCCQSCADIFANAPDKFVQNL